MAYKFIHSIMCKDLAPEILKYLGPDPEEVESNAWDVFEEIVFNFDQFDITFADYCRNSGVHGWVSVMCMYREFHNLMWDLAWLIRRWEGEDDEMLEDEAFKNLSARIIDYSWEMDKRMSRNIMMEFYPIMMRCIIRKFIEN